MKWRWLESTRELQWEFFDAKTENMSPEEVADYIVWNHTALVKELSEFLDEVGWKPWAAPRGWVNREAAVKELVDVGHFLANLAYALDVTDDEWETVYREKQEVNRQRQRDGYDGVSGKCPECKRDLTEDSTRYVLNDIERCVGCGGHLRYLNVNEAVDTHPATEGRFVRSTPVPLGDRGRVTEQRVAVERVDAATGDVTGRGTARMRGVTLDDYQTANGGELKLRPGEMFVVVAVDAS